MRKSSYDKSGKEADGENIRGISRRSALEAAPHLGASAQVGRTVRIGPIDVKIISDEEAEAVAFVMCGNDSYFPDDIKTTCAQCKKPIVHRPHVPKRPPKVCMACAVMLSQFEGKLPN